MFEFENHLQLVPTRIVFGVGRAGEISEIVLGKRVLLVTSKGCVSRGLAGSIAAALEGKEVSVFASVEGNPDLDSLDRTIDELRGLEPDEIVAIGGGSALDTAKALSVGLAQNDWSLRDHFESNVPLSSARFVPMVAIPTTAGTGSEVTPFATIWNRAERKKLSLYSPSLFPRVSLLDPELTLTLPHDHTIHCGLDALSQGLESIWNRNANTSSLPAATQAVALAFQTLPLLVERLNDLELRTRMLEASLLSGLAISQTRTALAHAISYPLTAHLGMPHGLACGFTLPALLAFNSQSDDGRLLALSQHLGFDHTDALREALSNLLATLEVGAIVRRFVPSSDIAVKLAHEMFAPGRADNNLRGASVSDVEGILEASLR